MAIKSLFRRWLEKRSTRKSEYYLSQRNIHILPGKQGLAFGVMLGLMLLTAINYQSSLVYLLVFILGSVFLISIWLCFFNMQGLTVRVSHLQPVEAGFPVQIKLEAHTAGKERSGFYAALDGESDVVYWAMEEQSSLVLDGRRYARGVYDLPAVRLETYFPFGLIRAWTWMWFDAQLLVYPKPIEPPKVEGGNGEEEEGQRRRDGEELGDAREYQSGDSMRRVLWKNYARREELIVRSRESVACQTVMLDWEGYASFGAELALSYMCFDVLKLYSDNQEFALVMPGVEIPLGSGESHRDQCLAALAGYAL